MGKKNPYIECTVKLERYVSRSHCNLNIIFSSQSNVLSLEPQCNSHPIKTVWILVLPRVNRRTFNTTENSLSYNFSSAIRSGWTSIKTQRTTCNLEDAGSSVKEEINKVLIHTFTHTWLYVWDDSCHCVPHSNCCCIPIYWPGRKLLKANVCLLLEQVGGLFEKKFSLFWLRKHKK